MKRQRSIKILTLPRRQLCQLSISCICLLTSSTFHLCFWSWISNCFCPSETFIAGFNWEFLYLFIHNSQTLLALHKLKQHPSLSIDAGLVVGCRREANKGYAFVNFTDARAAWKFYLSTNHQEWDVFQSSKIREIACARLQVR